MPSCFFKNSTSLRAYHQGCEGRLQAHHVLSKNKLKREFPYGAVANAGTGFRPALRAHQRADCIARSLDTILGDERNLLAICSRHHELVTNHRIYIPRSAMASVEEFAKDYGLEGWLDAMYRKQAA